MNTNRLAKEKSPYLLQHAHNPVDWFPWGDEAFEKARREDKPVFLSIGYSTCHWCHVMAHESFENPEIAAVLNEYFVSIKVDREERPDIDHTYMSVVMALTGGGGWPLSAFLTPDKEPFYGGTYFPPEPKWGSPGFKDVLLSLTDAWKNRRSEVLQSGQSITEALRRQTQKEETSSYPVDEKTFDVAFAQLKKSFDPQYGGFGQQPKFPTSHTLSFLLRYWKRSGNQEALHMTEKTLSEMAKGGMYDHLGGGFHRYSTDQKWQIPHFEKMLYDQAILGNTYLEAYRATGKPLYAQAAREIFDYVLRDMQQQKGGFFSAEDADSVDPEDSQKEAPHKKEGAFFLWKEKEINRILGKEDAAVFNHYYGVLPDGNAEYDPHGEFTGKNVLFAAHDLTETAGHFKKSASDIETILKRSKQKLFQARSERPKPHLDDKVLVDWNGLMISSLAAGSRVLNDNRYRQAAESAAQFILNNLVTKNGRLLHRYRDGESAVSATLADYAFFTHGLIDLYEATFDAVYLQQAQRLTREMLRLFWDEKNGGFFLTAFDSEEILFRQKEIYDGAIPSGNSIAALDLIRLARMTSNREFEQKAQMLFRAFGDEVGARASAYAQLLIALDFAIGPSKEIVIAGDADSPKTVEMAKQVFKPFLPNKVVIFRPANDKEAAAIISVAPFVREQPALDNGPTAYVCHNHACKLPTNDLKKLEELLGGN